MKIFSIAVIFILLMASVPTRAAQDFYLSQSRGSDCIHEGIVNKVLSKNDILAKHPSNTGFFFLEANDCGGGSINIGINGETYDLDKIYPQQLGLSIDYYNESHTIKVSLKHINYIYKDVKNEVETDTGVICVPEYRLIQVDIEFKGMKKTVLGTAVGNCP